MTLLLYTIAEQRWIRPHHFHYSSSSSSSVAVASSATGRPNNANVRDDMDYEDDSPGAAHMPNSQNNHNHNHLPNNNNGGVDLHDHDIGVHVDAVGGNSNNHHNHNAHGAGDMDTSYSSNGGAGQNAAGGGGDASVFWVKGTPPPGRNGHTATLVVDPDDEEHARLFIIGGWLGTGPLAAADTHVLDLSNGGRHMRWYQPTCEGTPPGPCNMHSADYVESRRELYVFRGGNGREYLNDLHALHVDKLKWRVVETRGKLPQHRANHSSAMLDDTNELIIMGGWNGSERLNDIHILNTETSTWTSPQVGGLLPHPRAGMTLTALRGRLFLFGGSGTSARCFQDLQVLDRKQMIWLDVSNCDGEVSYGSNRNHRIEMQPYENDDNPRYRFGGHSAYNSGRNHGVSSSTRVLARGEQFAGYGDVVSSGQMQGDGTPTTDAASVYGGAAGAPGGGTSGTLGTHMGDWRSRESAAAASVARSRMMMQQQQQQHASPNPNDEDTVPMVLVQGRGPGRRAGHTATAVGRRIYVFGGSCGTDYLNDFFILDTDPPPRAVVSEPTNMQLIDRRLRHFFNDEEFADVTFVVQGQRVYGHKMILSIVSDCFRAMFTTGFRESAEMEIEIPDCSHGAFLAVMEYIYTSALPKLDISNGTARDREVNRIVEMLELADRFFLDHLKQVCENLLQHIVNAETVEYLLTVAQKTNASQLKCICEHYIRNEEVADNIESTNA